MLIEYYCQKNNEKFDDFIMRVNDEINEVMGHSPINEKKLINIQWFRDNDSFYPFSCIITFYVGYSSS